MKKPVDLMVGPDTLQHVSGLMEEEELPFKVLVEDIQEYDLFSLYIIAPIDLLNS